MESIQEVIISLMYFINRVLLPLLFSIALLFFVYNAFRFFIAGANDQESRGKAKQLALYGVGAFVLLVSLWGIVNLLVWGLGWGAEFPVTPDYMDGTYYYW